MARTAPTRKAAKKKQTVLRRTTVYRGSRSAAPSPRIDANKHGATQAARRTTKVVTGPESGGNPQQPHSGRLTHVRYAKVVKPDYPDQARAQGWQGTTVLNVLVNQAGKSAKVLVYRTSGFNLLDDAAVNAMWRWEFYPARNGPQAVPSWVRVPIVFKLKEGN
jgi:protein TonB